ncbi:MAG: hypothetical protein AAFY28_11235 [Actinomycetota bacterium]
MPDRDGEGVSPNGTDMSIIIRAWYEQHDGTTRARLIADDGEHVATCRGIDDIVAEVRTLLERLSPVD